MKGFLPTINPIKDYSVASLTLERLNETARNLPKLLLTNRISRTIDSLKKNDFSVDKLIIKKEDQNLRLAMVQLSFIAHAYITRANWSTKGLSKCKAGLYMEEACIQA